MFRIRRVTKSYFITKNRTSITILKNYKKNVSPEFSIYIMFINLKVKFVVLLSYNNMAWQTLVIMQIVDLNFLGLHVLCNINLEYLKYMYVFLHN